MSNGGRSSDASVKARRQQLLELVLQRGDASIRELADELGVSVMTAHRDADALAGEQLLHKDRGRVSAPSTLLVQTSAAFRLRAAQAIKEAVAAAAISVLAGASTILLDDSTSGLPLLPLLAEAPQHVTVVTNYLRAAQAVGGAGSIDVHLLGGRYVPELDAVFGAATVEAISRWRADVSVFSNPALSHGRLFHMLQDSAQVKKAMLAAASTKVLLLDSSKLGRTAPHVVCDYRDIDVVIVDDRAAPQEVELLQAQGVQVILVPTPTLEATAPLHARV